LYFFFAVGKDGAMAAAAAGLCGWAATERNFDLLAEHRYSPIAGRYHDASSTRTLPGRSSSRRASHSGDTTAGGGAARALGPAASQAAAIALGPARRPRTN